MQAKPALRGPRGANDAAALVAQPVASCLGGRTPSNLDSTRMRIVKRGCVVEFPGGATASVARVRAGLFYTDVRVPGTGFRFHPCRIVRVVS